MMTIFWIGDSIVQTNDITSYPRCGMGQALPLYLKLEVRVANHAQSGRSTKSFFEEGWFAPVEAGMCAGDLMLIQFGHNDSKSEDPTRYTKPFGDFSENLRSYIRAARAKGALPVLVTPICRRRFDENGALQNTHGRYPEAMRAVAKQENTPCIDLTAASSALVQELGEMKSRQLYMYFPADSYLLHPQVKEDNTHLRYDGAVVFSGMVAQGLYQLGGIYREPLLPEFCAKMEENQDLFRVLVSHNG